MQNLDVFQKDVLYYLKDSTIERERGTDFASLFHSLNGHISRGLARQKPLACNSNLAFPSGLQGCKQRVPPLLLFQAHQEGIGSKVEQLERKQMKSEVQQSELREL